MVDFNKEDWTINNRNVFELPKTENVPISTIQYEILKQIEDKNITNILDFLNAEIDTQKTITLTKGLNIDTIFSKHLEPDINPLKTTKTPVFLIYEWLTLYLYKILADNDHFLTTDTYKEKYQTIKNDWLNQNIDTDEKDFVNNELAKCEAIILELQKPIYSKLLFSEVQPEPTEFKRNLSNIIDKRMKFLNEILNSLEAQMKSEKNRKAKELKNSNQLLECYNSIIRIDLFEFAQQPDNISGCNYLRILKDWKTNRNNNVLSNTILNTRKNWLIPFNNNLVRLMEWLVITMNKVIKWRDTNEKTYYNNFEIQLSQKLEFFNQIPTCIRLNYDTDEYLTLKLQEYFLNGFKQMITHSKENLMIDIERTPFFNEIQNIITQIQNEIDFNKVDLLLRHKPISEKKHEALPPQQPETNKSDEVTKELHNHIFKGNAFEVFEKYHINKSLAENSRTDLNLLFQLFKNDNLFVETVELKHYIQWLNKNYGYGLTELKKVDINSKPNIQRTNDYKEYKRTTLKQP